MKLSTLIKETKYYALDTNISDEDWLNAILQPFISAGNVKGANGEEYHIDKCMTSRLVNGKDDVPQKLRKPLGRIGIRDETALGMMDFLTDYVNPVLLKQFKKYLAGEIQIDSIIQTENQPTSQSLLEEASSLLTELLIQTLSVSNINIAKKKVIWKNGANAAWVIAGDLFHYGFENRKKAQKNIVVIPVNTAFDTHVTRKFEGESNPVISDMTIHGQWLSRMEQSGEDLGELDKRISDSLACLGYKAVSIGKSENGKCELYEMGSVAVIETKNAVYFLLAISEFDEANHAQSTPENIKRAVNSLLQVYDRIGQGYEMYMPVIGAGRSRTGLLFGEAYKLLAAVLNDNRAQIQGQIYIVVKPENIDEIEEGENDISH